MMTEVIVGAGILWLAGIPLFMYVFSEFLKEDPKFADMLRMNLEMNPMGLVLLSAAIVFWPIVLFVRVVNKR